MSIPLEHPEWKIRTRPCPSRLHSKSKIRQVWERTHGHCSYCGCVTVAQYGQSESYVMDHLHPVKAGGGDHISNLLLACYACNALKSDYSLEEFRPRFIQSRSLGIPLFNRTQLDWLIEMDIDIEASIAGCLIGHKFYFERLTTYTEAA